MTKTSAADVAAKAYFPEAKSWLDIGRRRLRYQLQQLEQRLLAEHGKRVEYPCDTDSAFYLTRSLGYQAVRTHFDYFVRHGHMKSPKHAGRQLMWSREDVVEFAMQLERMRYWSVGRHDEKKTVWELQDEAEKSAPVYSQELQTEIDASNADELLARMVSTAGKNSRALRAYLSGYYSIRLWETNRRLDGTAEDLLQQLIDEDNLQTRQAIATTLQRRLEK